MKNSELLKEPNDKFISALDSQRRYVLRIEGRPRGCPHCGTEQAKWEIHGISDVDNYDLNSPLGDVGKCKACDNPIRWCVPLIGDCFFGTVPNPALAKRS